MAVYSIKEEIANGITHGIGILFSVVTMTILIVIASINYNFSAIIGFSIYGLCSVLLYTFSTLYHSFQKDKVKRILRVFDHASIFLFIAGTYTPVALIALDGAWRLGILIAVWSIAILGIVFKILTYNKFDKFKKLSLAIYISMGWIAIIAIKPILAALPLGFMLWLAVGGLAYTLGTIFYANKKIPFNHAIWHVFVLLGSVCHFVGIASYLI